MTEMKNMLLTQDRPLKRKMQKLANFFATFVVLGSSHLQAAELRRDIKGVSTGMTRQEIVARLPACGTNSAAEIQCGPTPTEYYFIKFTNNLSPNVAFEIEYKFCSKEPTAAVFDKISTAYQLNNRADVKRTEQDLEFKPTASIDAYVGKMFNSCEVDSTVPMYHLTVTDSALIVADRKAQEDRAAQRFPTPGFN